MGEDEAAVAVCLVVFAFVDGRGFWMSGCVCVREEGSNIVREESVFIYRVTVSSLTKTL